jgi:hypothetical protein
MRLGFSEIEVLFAVRFGVDLPSIPFRGRLQHLQRNEFPSDRVRPGKGSKAIYGWEDIFQLSVALDLIDVGLTPDAATKLVRASREAVLMGASYPGNRLDRDKLLRAVRDKKCPFADTPFIVAAAHALFAYGSQSRLEPTLSLSTGKDLLAWLKDENPYDAAGIYLDLGKRLMLTLNDLAFAIKGGALEETVANYQEWAESHVLSS